MMMMESVDVDAAARRGAGASARGDRHRGGSWTPFGDRRRSPRPRLGQ